MIRLSGVLVLFSLLFDAPAQAQALVADLTAHEVAITTGFTGTRVSLFGAIENGGEIVATVKGPARETVVRRKSRVGGVWLNTRSVAFEAVPGYYRLFSSAALNQIMPPAARRVEGIGADMLALAPAEPIDAEDAGQFRTALIERLVNEGLFQTSPGPINVLDGRLFEATLDFPATIPTGQYDIEVLLLRQGQVVARQSLPLVIAPSGLDADIKDFSSQHGALYGVVAVLAAAMAGWFASFLFRNA
jgi:uncharacterized protein (TIGR02186 family)